MRRRHLLAVPLLAVLPIRATPAWRRDITELRAPAAEAAGLASRLSIAVRPVEGDIVAALDAGHLEYATLDAGQLRAARARMGERLLRLPGPGPARVTRRALPSDLVGALASTSISSLA